MRKFFLCFICLNFILLCGCKTDTGLNPQLNNLAFNIDVNNGSYIFDAKTDENSDLYISVVSPENISNLKLFFKGDTVTANYLELEKEIPLKSLEEDSIFRIIYESILSAQRNTINDSNNEYFIEYSIKNTAYTLFFGETGLPLKIESSDSKTEILFKGVTILNN